jgi:hypothetical protein
MLSIMIIITTANFLSIVVRKGEPNLRLYSFYAAGLVILYSFLAATRLDFFLIRWVKTFYEISYLKSIYWDTTVLIALISAVVLVILQRLRRNYLAARN